MTRRPASVALAALVAAPLLLAGCASQDPREDLRAAVRDATLAANDGNGAEFRSSLDGLLSTVRAQIASGDLPTDEGQRISALAEALRGRADSIDRELLEQREAEQQRQQQEQEQQQREQQEREQREQQEREQREQQEREQREQEERERQEQEERDREEQEEQEQSEQPAPPSQLPTLQTSPAAGEDDVVVEDSAVEDDGGSGSSGGGSSSRGEADQPEDGSGAPESR